MADTIFAPATAPGRAGVAILRVSGPAALSVHQRLTAMPLPPARRAAMARFRDSDGEPIDQGLVLWFPAPRSFTGEDVWEAQVHGSRAVMTALVQAVGAVPGTRLAEPGEFARRAFLNGRMDLTEAEGLADLIAAETAGQRRQALRQMEGGLGRLYEGWRSRLVRVLAHLEADLDFPEEDLPTGLGAKAGVEVAALAGAMTTHLGDGRRGERLRDGLQVAIVGAPNVGKSSLLNTLARREAAIVAAEAGTTRDVIEVRLDLDGWPITLADTAGLRDSGDAIEREGIRRAVARAEAADLRLVVLDATTWPTVPPEVAALMNEAALVVANKADLGPIAAGDRAVLPISARTGQGIDALMTQLAVAAEAQLESGEAPVISRERHRMAVGEASSCLGRALTAPLPELAAEELRLAARALGRVTGRVDVEDLLDVIFAEFCIGK